MAELLDNPFSDHMVGEAGKRLGTDDIVYAAVDQFDHFTGQKPSFSGLVADGNNGACIFYGFVNAGGRCKVPALFQSLCSATS